MDISNDMQVVAVQPPPPPAVPPHCTEGGSQPHQQVNILNMINIQPVHNVLIGAAKRSPPKPNGRA